MTRTYARVVAEGCPVGLEQHSTILQVSQPPLASPERYDSLRASNDVQEADHA